MAITEDLQRWSEKLKHTKKVSYQLFSTILFFHLLILFYFHSIQYLLLVFSCYTLHVSPPLIVSLGTSFQIPLPLSAFTSNFTGLLLMSNSWEVAQEKQNTKCFHLAGKIYPYLNMLAETCNLPSVI